jgi:hypothetical protein
MTLAAKNGTPRFRHKGNAVGFAATVANNLIAVTDFAFGYFFARRPATCAAQWGLLIAAIINFLFTFRIKKILLAMNTLKFKIGH